MFRRSSRSTTPLDQKQEQLVRQENELRDRMQKLERLIADAPRAAEETARRQREELLMRANEGRSRLDVSMALQDKRFSSEDATKRRGSLRKERQEGRIVFLVLVIALAGIIVWLLSHFRF